MKNLIVITIICAFCVSVNAEVLVFKTITSGEQLNISTLTTEQNNNRGYLVLDVDMSNPTGVIVNEAYYLIYVSNSGVKTQSTIILDPRNVEMIFAANGKKMKMILRWFDDPTGTYTVISGTAKSTDIGDIKQIVATSASGSSVWRLQDYMTGYAKITLKLDTADTRPANTQSKAAMDVLESLSLSLESKGYRTDL